MSQRPIRRPIVKSVRFTEREYRLIVKRQKPTELFSECARRLLLVAASRRSGDPK